MGMTKELTHESETMGLTSATAAERLQQDGFNELPASGKRSFLRILFEVVRQPMFALLIGGGVRILAVARAPVANGTQEKDLPETPRSLDSEYVGLLGLPLIITLIHIAFLEMVIDPACSIVFEAEQEEDDVMKHTRATWRIPCCCRKEFFGPSCRA